MVVEVPVDTRVGDDRRELRLLGVAQWLVAVAVPQRATDVAERQVGEVSEGAELAIRYTGTVPEPRSFVLPSPPRLVSSPIWPRWICTAPVSEPSRPRME